MSQIAIYSITSELHNAEAVRDATNEFLHSLNIEYLWRGDNFPDFGSHTLHLIYVCTGGTEGIFMKWLPLIAEKSHSPIYLLTSGKSNSLAASMEILAFIQQRNLKGEIIHGAPGYISQRISLLLCIEKAREQLRECKLGIIGKPSDWLIASDVNAEVIRQKTGISLMDIPMDELIETIHQTSARTIVQKTNIKHIDSALPDAYRIYDAIKVIIERYKINGLTIRCFDLLSTIHNTGCLALAKLNAEGIVAGCEGDIPTMITMAMAQAVLTTTGFQANPAQINVQTGEVLFAHCTIPLNMVERYEYDTHFESGIGVGIRGYANEGPVTVFKVAGDISRHFIAEGQLLKCLSKPDLCRTQWLIRLNDHASCEYFLKQPIGNHHVILRGHHKMLLEQLLS